MSLFHFISITTLPSQDLSLVTRSAGQGLKLVAWAALWAATWSSPVQAQSSRAGRSSQLFELSLFSRELELTDVDSAVEIVDFSIESVPSKIRTVKSGVGTSGETVGEGSGASDSLGSATVVERTQVIQLSVAYSGAADTASGVGPIDSGRTIFHFYFPVDSLGLSQKELKLLRIPALDTEQKRNHRVAIAHQKVQLQETKQTVQVSGMTRVTSPCLGNSADNCREETQPTAQQQTVRTITASAK